MLRQDTALPGVYTLEPALHGDHRGYFMETYSKRDFEALGIVSDFVQDNQSFTAQKGTLRGLHFQNHPYSQAKLVRVNRGAVWDVAVDIRRGSPDYLKWIAVELSDANRRMLFIPRGFAHGFLTLTDDVEFLYKTDQFFSKEHDRSIRYDDPAIGVRWPAASPALSGKDSAAPFLSDSDCNYIYEE
jgi:dTDP-4-dehydrorhamnose 3,5-epimerase